MEDRNTITEKCIKCGNEEKLIGLEAWSVIILGYKCVKCGHKHPAP